MEQMAIFVITLLLTILQLSECVYSDCNKKQKLHVGRHGNYTWPTRDVSVAVKGDIVLGALHAVHENSDSNTCGQIKEKGGIQALEMMLYTLDNINNNPDLLPGVSLGILAKDECDNVEYGLERARELLRGSMIYSVIEPDSSCMDEPDGYVIHPAIRGIIGTSSSVSSIRLANLLKPYKIPQVSSFATSTIFRDKERFPFFLRTIPPGTSEIPVLVELVKKFNWTFASVLFDNSDYGIPANYTPYNVATIFLSLGRYLFGRDSALFLTGWNQFQFGRAALGRHLVHHNVCIAISENVQQYTDVSYDRLARKLFATKARGVIILASGRQVSDLLSAFRRNKITKKFSWIWGDSSSGEGHYFHGNEAAFEGALTVHRQVHEVARFKDYFLSLTPFKNYRNPWFVEFWEQQFKCKFPGSRMTPYNEDYNRRCTGMEKIDPHGYKMEARLEDVSNAVMAFAVALHNMLIDVCGASYRGLCDDMTPVDGDLLMGYLRNVSFKGLSGERFRFLRNGDGPSKYVISNFIQDQPGHYTWREVGYFESEIPLSLHLDTKQYPESLCREPCGPGKNNQAQRDQCCWMCPRVKNNGGRIKTNLAITCFIGIVWSLWSS